MSMEVSSLFVCTLLYLDSIDFYDTLCFITRNIELYNVYFTRIGFIQSTAVLHNSIVSVRAD